MPFIDRFIRGTILAERKVVRRSSLPLAVVACKTRNTKATAVKANTTKVWKAKKLFDDAEYKLIVHIVPQVTINS